MVCGDESLSSEQQSLTLLPRLFISHGTGERNHRYALLMKANKPETALYRAPIFSLLELHGRICSCILFRQW